MKTHRQSPTQRKVAAAFVPFVAVIPFVAILAVTVPMSVHAAELNPQPLPPVQATRSTTVVRPNVAQATGIIVVGGKPVAATAATAVPRPTVGVETGIIIVGGRPQSAPQWTTPSAQSAGAR